MSADLKIFRKEAIDSLGTQPYGTVLLLRTGRHYVIYGILIGIVTIFFLILIFGSYTRKANAHGVLLPIGGLVPIVSQSSGRVISVSVGENSHVKQGDELFVLSADRSSLGEANVDARVGELLHARRDSIVQEALRLDQQTVDRLDAERTHIKLLQKQQLDLSAQQAFQRKRVIIANQILTRYLALVQGHAMAPAAADQKKDELLLQQQNLSALDHTREAANSDLENAKANLKILEAQRELDSLIAKRNESDLDQQIIENDAKRATVVYAPRAGLVTAITPTIGDLVTGGHALAFIVPEKTSLEAILFIPSAAAGFVRDGMQVKLRYDAFPYEKYGEFKGTLRDVSAIAQHIEGFSITSSSVNDASPGGLFYRAHVALDTQGISQIGPSASLRPGMSVDANILIERRKLYEWILDPLRAILRGL